MLYFLADSYILMGNFDSAKNTLAVLYQQYPNNQFAEVGEEAGGKNPAKIANLAGYDLSF